MAIRLSSSKPKNACTGIPRPILRIILLPGTIFLMLVGIIVASLGAGLSSLDWDEVSDTPFMYSSQHSFLGEAFAFGVWTSVVSFFGCLTVGCRFHTGLLVYPVIILVSILLQGGATASLTINKLSKAEIKHDLKLVFKGYKEGKDNRKSEYLDHLFFHSKCCGITNYSLDFAAIKYKDVDARVNSGINPNMSSVPYTCCKKYEPSLSDLKTLKECLEKPTKANIYTKGCLDEVVELADGLAYLAIIVISVTSTIEIFLAICSLILYCSERRSDI